MSLNKLLPPLAIMALFLGLVSVAHAQSTTPTVSTVAITSSPGADNTYATGDTITVGVTFSEAVTVSTTGGTPRITLDIGGQPRYASYTGAGSAHGAGPVRLHGARERPGRRRSLCPSQQPRAGRRDYPSHRRFRSRHPRPLRHELCRPQGGHRGLAGQQPRTNGILRHGNHQRVGKRGASLWLGQMLEKEEP